jgi:hypothetical protein
VKFVPPFGRESEGDAAQYVNGDPTIGRQGSIPPANAFEHPMRELVAAIAKSGFTPSGEDLQQLTKAVRSQYLNYADDTGSANNLSVAYDPPLRAYTRGLVLRVRVRETNNGPSRINAGAGNVPIRKMNGADVGEGELPIGAVATLVFDGTAFQLSNYGGAGGTGAGDVFMVNIPYAVDNSDTPGIIRANFAPPITEIGAGDILAVKIAMTAPGTTRMYINNLPPIELLPNGGGQMLQGDLVANDVVQFFFDGTYLRFPPNPEMTAPVTYSIGPGQQFASVDAAMDALKRKTIGARGFVTLQLIAGVFDGPISVSHPSGDRIAIRGTMIGARPQWNEFAASGNSAQQRAQDAIFNINMLRTRYGTEIRPLNDRGRGYGLANMGPGRVLFQDLLIVGMQLPVEGPDWWQMGVLSDTGFSCSCDNVTCWGCQTGFSANGAMYCSNCFATASTWMGYHLGGGDLTVVASAALGCTNSGFYSNFGNVHGSNSRALMNGQNGFASINSSAIQVWYTHSLGNGYWDHVASTTSSIVIILPADFGPTSPARETIGNLGSVVHADYYG